MMGDLWSGTYKKPAVWDETAKRLIELAELAPGATVLDVGTGYGGTLFPAVECIGETGRIVSIDGLISEGNLSLLNAVEKFDFTRGIRFSTYATWCVVKRFARVVPEENYVIKTYMTGSDEVIEIQPDKSVTELERKENLDHIRIELDHVMGELTEREQKILRLRFGLVGRPQTLEEIGGVLGITRERVRQLEMRALRKAAEFLDAGGH